MIKLLLSEEDNTSTNASYEDADELEYPEIPLLDPVHFVTRLVSLLARVAPHLLLVTCRTRERQNHADHPAGLLQTSRHADYRAVVGYLLPGADVADLHRLVPLLGPALVSWLHNHNSTVTF